MSSSDGSGNQTEASPRRVAAATLADILGKSRLAAADPGSEEKAEHYAAGSARFEAFGGGATLHPAFAGSSVGFTQTRWRAGRGGR